MTVQQNRKRHHTISTIPIIFLSAPNDIIEYQIPDSLGTEMRIAVTAKERMSDWLCINHTIESLLLWSKDLSPASAI